MLYGPIGFVNVKGDIKQRIGERHSAELSIESQKLQEIVGRRTYKASCEAHTDGSFVVKRFRRPVGVLQLRKHTSRN